MFASMFTLLLLPFIISVVGFTQNLEDERQACYKTGDKIAPEVFFQDAQGNKISLLDLVKPETKVVYLLIYGGPSLAPDNAHGGFWCQDSFNDMPTSTYMYRKYKNKGVTFVPVACPPVYSEEEYGYVGETFLASADTTALWQREFGAFVSETLNLQFNKLIAFDQLYFDPKFRLMFNKKKNANFAGPIESWMGKFKPCTDNQSYSVPVVWLLSPEGEVLHEPFVGNRYSQTTQRINYTVLDIEAALLKALKSND